jgi:glycosyltransferase involved in cell wall biosynthesis
MMKNIAYITEQDINGKINGAITRDLILLKILKQIGEVTIYYSDVKKYGRYEYLLNNKHIPHSINDINCNQYDVVIISTHQASPYLMGYKKIIHKKIFYLCDSYFHMKKTLSLINFNLKYLLLFAILSFNEFNLLKQENCAYLGNDEIDSLPVICRKNAIILPFFIDAKKHNYFNKNGYILYIGDFSYWPNKKALKIILRMAPRLDATIKIFGLNIPKMDKVPKNVKLCGYVESLDDVYIGAKALIYPVALGTGIKNKVIEAMSYGIPVIGYKNAFTNMNVEHNKNVIIINNRKEILNALKRTDFDIISKNAYSFIKNEMSKESALTYVEKYI